MRIFAIQAVVPSLRIFREALAILVGRCDPQDHGNRTFWVQRDGLKPEKILLYLTRLTTISM